MTTTAPTPTFPGQAAAPAGPCDLTGMYLMHHGFRRDLDRLNRAAAATPYDERGTWRSIAGWWRDVAALLAEHHTKEDELLWPVLLERIDDAGREVLDAMADEHHLIDPALDAVRAALRVSTPGQLGEMLLVGAVLDATADLLAERLDAARATFDAVCREITLAGDPNGPQIELWARFTVGFVGGDTAGLLPMIRAQLPRLPRELNDLLACALLDAGDVEGARSAWEPTDWERDGTWLFRTVVRAWLAVRLGEAHLLRRLYDDLAPWAGHLALTLNGALALGPVDHYLGLLAAALGDDQAASAHHAAAVRQPGAGLAARRA